MTQQPIAISSLSEEQLQGVRDAIRSFKSKKEITAWNVIIRVNLLLCDMYGKTVLDKLDELSSLGITLDEMEYYTLCYPFLNHVERVYKKNHYFEKIENEETEDYRLMVGHFPIEGKNGYWFIEISKSDTYRYITLTDSSLKGAIIFRKHVAALLPVTWELYYFFGSVSQIDALQNILNEYYSPDKSGLSLGNFPPDLLQILKWKEVKALLVSEHKVQYI